MPMVQVGVEEQLLPLLLSLLLLLLLLPLVKKVMIIINHVVIIEDSDTVLNKSAKVCLTIYDLYFFIYWPLLAVFITA
jgi:hypothetical protein